MDRDAALEPEEFARAFQRLLDWVGSAAGREESFAARPTEHFGADAGAFPDPEPPRQHGPINRRAGVSGSGSDARGAGRLARLGARGTAPSPPAKVVKPTAASGPRASRF